MIVPCQVEQAGSQRGDNSWVICWLSTAPEGAAQIIQADIRLLRFQDLAGEAAQAKGLDGAQLQRRAVFTVRISGDKSLEARGSIGEAVFLEVFFAKRTIQHILILTPSACQEILGY